MKHTFREGLAVHHLRDNAVVAHPTDTIYGFSCLPTTSAINKIIKLKKRNINKGFILLASDIDYVMAYIDSNFVADLEYAVKKTTQPTTFLVPKNNKTSELITGKSDFVAIRLTKNSLIKFLCESTNSALISTSANLQGKIIVKSLIQLKKQSKDYLSFALPPIDNNNKSSIIINLVSGEQIR